MAGVEKRFLPVSEQVLQMLGEELPKLEAAMAEHRGQSGSLSVKVTASPISGTNDLDVTVSGKLALPAGVLHKKASFTDDRQLAFL